MTRLVVESKVDSNGMLRLSVPVGADEANRSVRVTIESLPNQKAQTEWSKRVESLAGSWEGDFERPADLPPEQRDPLP